MVEMMLNSGKRLPCLHDKGRAITDLRERFHVNKTDQQCIELVDGLVYEAAENWRTIKYDAFQKSSVGIL